VVRRERSAEDGEILRKDKNVAPVDMAGPGDDTVAVKLFLFEPKVVRLMGDEFVELVKAPRI
jgi:hypothetical protein